MPRAAPTPQLSCPRCGYDVSGVVPTWKESCPLDGTCSECGLKFPWADLFAPDRLHPHWSFEHARKKRVLSLLGTIVRTARPGLLWKQLRLAAPVRPARLAVLVATVALATHLLTAGAAAKLYGPLRWPPGWAWTGTNWARTTGTPWREVCLFLAWPYSETLYWFRVVGPFSVFLLAWSALAPLPFLVLPKTMAQAQVRRAHLFRGWAYGMVLVCGLGLLDVALTVVHFMSTQSKWANVALAIVNTCRPVIVTALALGAGSLLVRWWWLFTSAYLQLPKPKRVTAAMLTISLLGAVIVCLVADRDFRNAMGGALNFALGWNAY